MAKRYRWAPGRPTFPTPLAGGPRAFKARSSSGTQRLDCFEGYKEDVERRNPGDPLEALLAAEEGRAP